MKSGADSLSTGSAPTTCILPGAEGENEDDCTTDEHEGLSGYSVQEPIYRTVFRVEVFSRGPYDLNAVENEFDWLNQINYDITDGPHIGQTEQVSSEVVPPETVESELVRIGNDGSFFSSDEEDPYISTAPKEEPAMASVESAPSIFGRERALIDGLVKALHKAAIRHGDYTEARETKRGSVFEVAIIASDGPTGRVARITVELDRVDMGAHIDSSEGGTGNS